MTLISLLSWTGRRIERPSLLLAGLLASLHCNAEPRYRLVAGMGYTVCEALTRKLNAFPTSDPPMICRQDLRQGDSTFTEPAWENMDIESNLRLVYAAEALLPMYSRPGVLPPPFDEWTRAFIERLSAGTIAPRLHQTRVWLTERGYETVVGYEPTPGACDRMLKQQGVAAVGDGMYLFVKTGSPDEPLAPIGGASWLPRQVLIYQGRVFLLGSGNNYEHRGKESMHVWSIDLAPVFAGARYDASNPQVPAFSGYVEGARCSVNLTLD